MSSEGIKRPIPPSLYEVLRIQEGDIALGLVSCGKAKISMPSEAKDIYSSTLFRRSFSVADQLCSEVGILSAKHGYLHAKSYIETYDDTLNRKSREERREWGQAVAAQLKGHVRRGDRVLYLGGEAYLSELQEFFNALQCEVLHPFQGLSLGPRGSLLKTVDRIVARATKARELYEVLRIAEKNHNRRPLKDLIASGQLPRRGVYIFSDPNEASGVSPDSPRIVRIGTHGVSANSKSSLRQRLRTHFGTGNGGGSHRSSVFRLHVGNAFKTLLGVREEFVEWGLGGTAPLQTRAGEAPLERRVSSYIGKLLVSVIPIDDDAGRHSMRSSVEQSLIGLLTEHNQYLEAASRNWLGLHSPRQEIVRSGLWNLQHSGSQADWKVLDFALARMRSYTPQAPVGGSEE